MTTFQDPELRQLHHEMVQSFKYQAQKQEEHLAETKRINGRLHRLEEWRAELRGAATALQAVGVSTRTLVAIGLTGLGVASGWAAFLYTIARG